MIEEMLKQGESNETVRDFLSWFKDIRVINKNICFIFSGSIKISVFEKMLEGKVFFNDCQEYSLQPFGKESAANLVEGLFYSHRYAVIWDSKNYCKLDMMERIRCNEIYNE